jgi:hypothetical protein
MKGFSCRVCRFSRSLVLLPIKVPLCCAVRPVHGHVPQAASLAHPIDPGIGDPDDHRERTTGTGGGDRSDGEWLSGELAFDGVNIWPRPVFTVSEGEKK